MKGISFTGDLSVKEIRSRLRRIGRAREGDGRRGRLRDPPLHDGSSAARAKGIRVDLSGEKTALKVNYTLAKFRAEERSRRSRKKKYLSGTMTVTPDLSLRGRARTR